MYLILLMNSKRIRKRKQYKKMEAKEYPDQESKP